MFYTAQVRAKIEKIGTDFCFYIAKGGAVWPPVYFNLVALYLTAEEVASVCAPCPQQVFLQE